MAFGLATLLLGLDSATLRAASRPSRSPTRGHVQRGTELAQQPFLSQCPVAHLRSFVVGDHPDHRAELGDHPRSLALGERRRRLHVELQVDPSGGLVGVLASRTTGRAEPDHEFMARDAYRIGHPQTIVVRSHSPSMPDTADVA